MEIWREGAHLTGWRAPAAPPTARPLHPAPAPSLRALCRPLAAQLAATHLPLALAAEILIFTQERENFTPLSCRSLGMLHTYTHQSDPTPATTITSGASGANLTAFQRSAALWPLAPSKTPLQTPQQLRGTSTASHCPCSHPCRGHLMQPQQQTGLLNMLVELAEPHGAGVSGTRMVADLDGRSISPAVPWRTLNPSLHGQAPQRSQASEALPYFATIVDLNA